MTFIKVETECDGTQYIKTAAIDMISDSDTNCILTMSDANYTVFTKESSKAILDKIRDLGDKV